MCVQGFEAFHGNVYSWNWDLTLKCVHPTRSNTHKENWLPIPTCYQLSTAHWLGVRLHIHFLSLCWDLFRLSLHRPGAFCLYNVCGFLCASALLCLVTLCPCIHSLPPAVTVIPCSLLKWSLSLGKRECNMNCPLKTEL